MESLSEPIDEMTRFLLLQSDLDESFWAKAVKTAIYTRNRTATNTLIDITLFKCWTGKKPTVSNVQILKQEQLF